MALEQIAESGLRMFSAQLVAAVAEGLLSLADVAAVFCAAACTI